MYTWMFSWLDGCSEAATADGCPEMVGCPEIAKAAAMLRQIVRRGFMQEFPWGVPNPALEPPPRGDLR